VKVKSDVRHTDFLQFGATRWDFLHYIHERRPVTNPCKGIEVCERLQSFHDYPIVKIIHVLQLLGRVVDCDPPDNRGEGFITPDPAQHFPRQRLCLVASHFQQRVGGVTRVRIREAYLKVVEEALQRDEAMETGYE